MCTAGFAVAAAAALLAAPSAFASNVGTGPNAVFTTFVDASTCLNGNGSGVNCNIYTTKDSVYASGGPVKAGLKGLPNGTYFFAVVSPGGQSDPNDGAGDLLSTDSYLCREFQVSGGALTYPTGVSSACPHLTGTDPEGAMAIQLMPYSDTPNPGGVYILAVCQLPASGQQPVDPSSCKYDAFKVKESQITEAAAPTVAKDANGTDTFTWSIQKLVDKTRVVDSSGTAKFTYTVSVTHDGGALALGGTITVFDPNLDQSNNTVPVAIDGITDQLSDSTICTVTGGGAQTLSQAATDFAYSCPISNLPNGELDNTVTVNWSKQTLSNGDVLDTGFADFTFKNITFAPIDDCVTVSDLLGGGTLGIACSTDPNNPTTFTYTNTVTGIPGTCVTVNNTATFVTDTTQTTGSDTRSVQLCTPVDLKVTKDANPSYTRTYLWSILKSVDKTRVDQLSGSVVFNYTIVVTEAGFTDSQILVAGTITITNPNDFEDIPLTSVTDAVDNGGACSITSGDPTGIVKAGQSATLGYVCTYSSVPSDGTNTATATWDGSAANTPSGAGSGTAAVHFGAPTGTVTKTITVTDTFKGSLGTLTATDPPAAPASQTFTYSRTVSVVVNTCVSYPNTATIVETGQTSSQSVTVCGGVAGGLTMGFWQNKNGQGIITSGASTSGVCNSATWLRQYAPFQDLSSTATCSQFATYVLNIIKAANASGSSMNAMLKAQMLATALDVYFSDPSLGGNKINAPAPLGGVKVDLTMICNMLDSGGSGTCSGAFTNTSSAFGGGTCQTVSALLAYAASQSNGGGSTWYGQVKATQQLAKNTFDAINNAQAFSC
jgi:hypothetical protein